MITKLYLTTKRLLIEASYYTGLTGLMYYSRMLRGRGETILIYHSIAENAAFPFIPAQMRVLPLQFEKHMAYLAKNCNVVSLAELGKRIADGSHLPPRTVVLTFDDGFKDNLSGALPVLLRYKLTATFFIVTDWVEARQLSWLHRLHYLSWAKSGRGLISAFLCEMPQMKNSIKGEIELLNRYELVRPLCNFILNNLTMVETVELVDAVWKKLEAMPEEEERELAARLYLSWNDVEQLSYAGMDVGSHTQSHPKMAYLSRYSAYSAEEEIVRSLKMLKKRLNKNITVFSYPFGSMDSFNNKCRDILSGAGVKTACALVGGGAASGRDVLGLNRLPVRDMPPEELALEISGIPAGLRCIRNRLNNSEQR